MYPTSSLLLFQLPVPAPLLCNKWWWCWLLCNDAAVIVPLLPFKHIWWEPDPNCCWRYKWWWWVFPEAVILLFKPLLKCCCWWWWWCIDDVEALLCKWWWWWWWIELLTLAAITDCCWRCTDCKVGWTTEMAVEAIGVVNCLRYFWRPPRTRSRRTPSLSMPVLRHFCIRQAWHAFRRRLLISQSLLAGHVYSILPICKNKIQFYIKYIFKVNKEVANLYKFVKP